jgi:hypothetical protein
LVQLALEVVFAVVTPMLARRDDVAPGAAAVHPL